MGLNDKLKAEIVAWMNKGIQRGATVPVFEDMVNKLEEETIKHCAEVVGEQIENMEIAKAMGKELEVTCYNQALLETQQRLLDLI